LWSNADNRTTTGFHQPNLVIEVNQLKENLTYTLKLEVYFEKKPDDVSYFKMSFMTALTPKGGRCSIE